MPPAPLVDPAAIDTSRVLVDRDAIRSFNPQRFEMEQLTAIIHLDLEGKLAIGYKDVEPDEFWVRGHMPDYPLMPGVMICEAAASSPAISASKCECSMSDSSRSAAWKTFGSAARSGSAIDSCSCARRCDYTAVIRSSIVRVLLAPTWSSTARSSVSPSPVLPKRPRRPDLTGQSTAPKMSRSRPQIDVSSSLIDPAQPIEESLIDWTALFGNDRPVELEIGSGKGLFLVNSASANPGHNFWGSSSQGNMRDSAAERLVQCEIANAKVWRGDARLVLTRHVPELSLRAIHVYFPGPVVEKATQKTAGVHRLAHDRNRTNARNWGASSCRQRRRGVFHVNSGPHRSSSSVPGTCPSPSPKMPSILPTISPISSGNTGSRGDRSTEPTTCLTVSLRQVNTRAHSGFGSYQRNDEGETRLERSPDRAGFYRVCRRKLRVPVRVLALYRGLIRVRATQPVFAWAQCSGVHSLNLDEGEAIFNLQVGVPASAGPVRL